MVADSDCSLGLGKPALCHTFLRNGKKIPRFNQEKDWEGNSAGEGVGLLVIHSLARTTA